MHGLILSKPKQCEGYILLIILRFHAHLTMWRLETDTNVFREFQLQKKKKKKKRGMGDKGYGFMVSTQARALPKSSQIIL